MNCTECTHTHIDANSLRHQLYIPRYAPAPRAHPGTPTPRQATRSARSPATGALAAPGSTGAVVLPAVALSTLTCIKDPCNTHTLTHIHTCIHIFPFICFNTRTHTPCTAKVSSSSPTTSTSTLRGDNLPRRSRLRPYELECGRASIVCVVMCVSFSSVTCIANSPFCCSAS
jgi:hypothetical protein